MAAAGGGVAFYRLSVREAAALTWDAEDGDEDADGDDAEEEAEDEDGDEDADGDEAEEEAEDDDGDEDSDGDDAEEEAEDEDDEEDEDGDGDDAEDGDGEEAENSGEGHPRRHRWRTPPRTRGGGHPSARAQ